MEMIFAVNKPVGITSHDVVNMVRRKTGIKRVGHGGTLDPMAAGVLVIAVGRENTKRLEEFVKGEKEYIAEIFLGAKSDTYDGEGIIENVNVKTIPNLTKVKKMIKLFIGNIEQVPPIYSSVKIAGKPAHRRARHGEVVKLDSRKVIVENIEILYYHYPILKLKIATGPGVYIRSIAHNLGNELGTGGYLKGLIRTKVNNFALVNAKRLDEL